MRADMEDDCSYEASRRIQRQPRFLGRAMIDLDCLEFEQDESQDATASPCSGNSHLKAMRVAPDCRIPVLIDKRTFQETLRKSDVSQTSLLDFRGSPLKLHLSTSQRLRALLGRHRLAGAAENLPVAERWWVVDLYPSEILESQIVDLHIQYTGSRKFDDGAIFWHVLHYRSVNGHCTGR